MPVARNVPFDRPDAEYTREGSEANWFDEGKDDLRKRVLQIQGGDHWAEEPRSRTTHIVSNIRVVDASDGQLKVNSRFVVYRTRLSEGDDDLFVGKRIDVLRNDGTLKFLHRTIYFDQSVLQAKYLTIFF
jgi:3-phenylpropionate/cinnamic acid dioxygenase small subunit